MVPTLVAGVRTTTAAEIVRDRAAKRLLRPEGFDSARRRARGGPTDLLPLPYREVEAAVFAGRLLVGVTEHAAEASWVDKAPAECDGVDGLFGQRWVE
jgi:hypothetical protein